MLSDFPPHVQQEIQQLLDAEARQRLIERMEAARRVAVLTDEQRDGLACVNCGGMDGPMRPVPDSSPQMFAHANCAGFSPA